jgi:AI-2E family transporter
MDQTNGPNHREDAVEKKTTGQENKTTSPVGPEHTEPHPTPIWISKRTRVPSILIFLAVIAGGEIAGLLGVVFAVPTVAVLKELFDFFRARVRTRSE